MKSLTSRISTSVTIGQNLDILSLSNVTIRCPVAGLPKPVISWSFDDRALEHGGNIRINGGKLVIRSANTLDSGRYTCVASNLVGQTRAQTVLTVIG